MILQHRDCGGLEITRASVITETLPREKDVALGSAGEGVEIGEPAQPLIIIGDYGGDLGLLEHDFGNKNGVWVQCSAPRKIPAVACEPAKNRELEGADFFSRSKGFQQTLNVQRSTSNVQFRVERLPRHGLAEGGLSVERWTFSANEFIHASLDE